MTKFKFIGVLITIHMYEPRKLHSRAVGNLNSASHVFTLGLPGISPYQVQT
jgi:hypothetical protein